MPLIASGIVSLLVIVTVCGLLGTPTCSDVLNVIDVGETATGAIAVPCTLTDVELMS